MKEELLEQIEKQHGISKNNILSVSQVSEYIQNKLSTDSKLNQIYVLGEVTNASESKSGFLFFDINLSFEIEDGLDVLVKWSHWMGSKADYYNDVAEDDENNNWHWEFYIGF